MDNEDKSRWIFQDRDYFQDIKGDIYQVWGSLHLPDAVYALHKYLKISENQKNNNSNELIWIQKSTNLRFQRIITSYTKENVAKNIEENSYKQFSPVFQTQIIIVPKSEIIQLWKPIDRFKTLMQQFSSGIFDTRQKLDHLERLAIEVGTIIIDECRIEENKVGITGSILWESHHGKSDIDFMIYGIPASNKVLQWLKALPTDGNNLRKGNNLELFQLAESLSIKHGSTPEDWFTLLYKKPYLFYYQNTKITINFAPISSELPSMPHYDSTAQFILIEPIELKATIISSRWGLYNPHLYLIRVEECNNLTKLIIGMKIRLLIIDQDFNGYFQPDTKIFIKGTLQKALHVLDETTMQYQDTFQVTIGLKEAKMQEQIQIL